jgi:hypothetical protein
MRVSYNNQQCTIRAKLRMAQLYINPNISTSVECNKHLITYNSSSNVGISKYIFASNSHPKHKNISRRKVERGNIEPTWSCRRVMREGD